MMLDSDSEPLAFRLDSLLHDEREQIADIANYVRNVVNSSPSPAMRRWRAEDKRLVIETLTEALTRRLRVGADVM